MTDETQAVPAEDIAGLIERLSGCAEAMDAAAKMAGVEQRHYRSDTVREAAAALTSLSAERDNWKQRSDSFQRDRARLFDEMNGTPCAEIRWRQEKEALEAESASLRRKLEEHRKALEPFGNISITLEPDGKEIAALHSEIIAEVLSLTVGDFRRARTLSGASE